MREPWDSDCFWSHRGVELELEEGCDNMHAIFKGEEFEKVGLQRVWSANSRISYRDDLWKTVEASEKLLRPDGP